MKIRFILAVGLIAPAFSVFADTRDIHDAHIADVVITASSIAIETAKLAQSKSSNEAKPDRLFSNHKLKADANLGHHHRRKFDQTTSAARAGSVRSFSKFQKKIEADANAAERNIRASKQPRCVYHFVLR